jgi:hypothetical protein
MFYLFSARLRKSIKALKEKCANFWGSKKKKSEIMEDKILFAELENIDWDLVNEFVL